MFNLPFTPADCYVCNAPNAKQIVPERSEMSTPLETLFYVYCPLCFDSMIGFFPINCKKIYNREIYGSFKNKRY